MLFLSLSSAFADEPRPAVTLSVNDQADSLELVGPTAKALYDSLDVRPSFHFSLVQTQTKATGAGTTCEMSIVGDIPGQMSESSYRCQILIPRK